MTVPATVAQKHSCVAMAGTFVVDCIRPLFRDKVLAQCRCGKTNNTVFCNVVRACRKYGNYACRSCRSKAANKSRHSNLENRTNTARLAFGCLVSTSVVPNNLDIVTCRCGQCGRRYRQQFESVIRACRAGGVRCRRCASKLTNANPKTKKKIQQSVGRSVFDTPSFIAKAVEIFGRTYDYSKVVYRTSKIPVIIICRKHGEFTQKPNTHLCLGRGCQKCSESYGERKIRLWLEIHNLSFKQQVKFDSCRNLKPLPFDFSVLHNGQIVLIEFDGHHHFAPVTHSYKRTTADLAYKRIKLHDKIKTEWCDTHGIKLLRISYLNRGEIDQILTEWFGLEQQ